MHKLWQHDNGTYYVLYGPRLKSRVSTRSKDRGPAEIFLSQFIAGAANPIAESPLINTILEQYESEHGPEVRSQESMKFSIRPLKAFFGNLQPHHITPPLTKQYARERGAGAGTVLREMGVLRAALRWARDHKRLTEVPHIRNPVKKPRPRDRYMTRAEGQALINACNQPHVKLFVMLGLMTAARSTAILELTWKQVDFEHNLIDYGEGHGNKRRAIAPINGELLEFLKATKTFSGGGPDAPVVEYRGEGLSTIKNGFKLACRRAKIVGVSPHILRHTSATWMAEAGVPIREIARMLGDSEEMTEKTYAKFSPSYLRNASDALQFKTA